MINPGKFANALSILDTVTDVLSGESSPTEARITALENKARDAENRIERLARTQKQIVQAIRALGEDDTDG